MDCVCSKMLNHGLFLSLFKLIPCPIHWIVYVLDYLNFIFEFKAVLALPEMADTNQTHKSIIFIWIVWITLYVYLWLLIQPWLYTISGSLQRKIKENCNSWQIDISHHSFPWFSFVRIWLWHQILCFKRYCKEEKEERTTYFSTKSNKILGLEFHYDPCVGSVKYLFWYLPCVLK